ncbi:MAG: glycosyltransferase family 2 protein [Candidatus Buchananbacteria bacterium]
MPQPEISIIIASWNVKNLLRHCLNSIYVNSAGIELEIFVVDNASTDQSVEMVRSEFPEVKVIANQQNLGFGRANNLALTQAQGKNILFLNPDTLIKKNCLANILTFLNHNPQAGIVGCQHLNPDLSLQPSVRRFPSFWPIFLIISKIAKIFPNLNTLNNYLARDFDYNLTQLVEQVAGSFMMIRHEVIDEIGGFDESFYLWFEEVDLCRRAVNAGWQVWYFAESQIIHYGGQSFSQQLTLKKQRIFLQSAWRYFKKHGF